MYRSRRSLSGGQTNYLPGSLFQLLELFCKLDYEVSIEVNKSMNGTIELFLTKGYLDKLESDPKHISATACGIYIHTHPFIIPNLRTKDMKYWPPSGLDIKSSNEKIIRGNLGNHQYVFDGYNLWYYKPNKGLIGEFFALSTLDKNDFQDSKEYFKIVNQRKNEILELLNNCMGAASNFQEDINGLRENKYSKINLSQYLSGMKDLFDDKDTLGYTDDKTIGIDIGIISNYRKNIVFIPDDLTCSIDEQRVKHIILPSSGLLNSEDLQFLYKRCIKIMDSRSNFTITQESFLG